MASSIRAVTQCPEVPEALLTPRASWKDPKAYDAKAHELAGKFRENFVQFAEREPGDVSEAGPMLWTQRGDGGEPPGRRG